jgi:AcrR family transcriptional regulator
VTTSLDRSTAKRRRLPRAARREQILSAATHAFAAAGFAKTSLDDIAEAAGVGRVILYRHFESKADLYRSVLDRAATRLGDSVGTDDFGQDAVPALVAAAAADPDGFRLLFRYAAREPEFRDVTDTLAAASVEVTRRDHHRGRPGLARRRSTRAGRRRRPRQSNSSRGHDRYRPALAWVSVSARRAKRYARLKG